MLADAALRGGHRLRHDASFFDTIVVEDSGDADALMRAALRGWFQSPARGR